MNQGVRAPRPTRSDYVVWRRATTRWADDDAYGHMNNATYYELFDTAVNAHLFEATGVNVRRLPAIGVVAETSCRYFREIGFPDPVDVGLVVERVGTSSVIYRIGLFQGGDTLASKIAESYQGGTTKLQVSSLIYLGLILLVFSLLMNVTAQWIVRRVARRQGVGTNRGGLG